MSRQFRCGRAHLNAAEQQGMLHLFREYCRQGLCDACPLGSRWLQNVDAPDRDGEWGQQRVA